MGKLFGNSLMSSFMAIKEKELVLIATEEQAKNMM